MPRKDLKKTHRNYEFFNETSWISSKYQPTNWGASNVVVTKQMLSPLVMFVIE